MTLPASAILVKSYEQLNQFATAFARRKINLLIVVGRPGIAKSETIRQAIPTGSCWLEGNATAFGMYETIHQHRDELVVIDDVDSLYSDKAAVRMLKSLCNTRPEKRLTWHSKATAGNLPREFTTTSRVCIIANDWKTLDENVSALVDRGQFIIFDPPATEVHAQTRHWIDDETVYSWFGQHLQFFPALSMRSYCKAIELRAAGFPWQSMMMSHLPKNVRVVVEILERSDLHLEADRVREFCRSTGASRATYFNSKKRAHTVLT